MTYLGPEAAMASRHRAWAARADLWGSRCPPAQTWRAPTAADISSTSFCKTAKIKIFSAVLRIRIRDPVSSAFLTPGSGMGNKSGSGSGMNNTDHISESLEAIILVKKLKFFDADPGWKKFGSGINIPDPQHWLTEFRNFQIRIQPYLTTLRCSALAIRLLVAITNLRAKNC